MTYHKKYRRTIKGLISQIYSGQRASSRYRKHPMPSYSLKEFREWVLSGTRFLLLYKSWVISGYIRDLKPSIGRNNHDKPYSLDNIHIETWRENYMEGRQRACEKSKSQQVRDKVKLYHTTRRERQDIEFKAEQDSAKGTFDTCGKGHKFTKANTGYYFRGKLKYRECKRCDLLRNRKYNYERAKVELHERVYGKED